MIAIITLLSLVSFSSVNGLWVASDNHKGIQIVFKETKEKLKAEIIINADSKCKKPICVKLSGFIQKEKESFSFFVESKSMPISKMCAVTFALFGHGEFVNINKLKTQAVIKTRIKCNDKIDIEIDDVSGIWLRFGRKTSI